VYKPALPKQRLDLVLDQFPKRGHMSSRDTVTLVLAKPLHGVVPNVTGLPLPAARSRIRARGFVPLIDRFDQGVPGRVLAQTPPPGVAGADRLPLRLVVGRG
jgi:beta-lactam-binding protein with PASTA domain